MGLVVPCFQDCSVFFGDLILPAVANHSQSAETWEVYHIYTVCELFPAPPGYYTDNNESPD